MMDSTTAHSIRITLDRTPLDTLGFIRQAENCDGVLDASVRERKFTVTYDLSATSVDEIVVWLKSTEAGVSDNPLNRCLIFLQRFQSSIRRECLGQDAGWDYYLREIYVSRYRHRRHGRRDDRKRHWRQYSKRKEPV